MKNRFNPGSRIRERAERAALNNEFAERAGVVLADRADGTTGVCLAAPGLIKMLNPDAAIQIANALVDAAEHVEGIQE